MLAFSSLNKSIVRGNFAVFAIQIPVVQTMVLQKLLFFFFFFGKIDNISGYNTDVSLTMILLVLNNWARIFSDTCTYPYCKIFLLSFQTIRPTSDFCKYMYIYETPI